MSAQRFILGNLVLLLLYVAGGKLGMLFALPPGYSIPVFPPAGLALAAILLFGSRALPGIFLGSWVFNSHLIPPQPDYSWVPVAIATGSTLQAWICARILRHFAPRRLVYDDVRSLAFFTVTSLLCCCIAASIGNLTLWKAGIIPAAAISNNFFTWWLGDCLGVQIFSLFILVIAADWPRLSFRSSVAFSGIVVGLGICSLIYSYEKDERLADFQNQLETNADLHMKRMETAMVSNLGRLQGLDAFLSSDKLNFADFTRYCELSPPKDQAFLNLQWAPLLKTADWPQLKSKLEAQIGRPIPLRTPPGQPSDSGESWVSPVCFVYPLPGNEEVLGINDMAVKLRSQLIRRAMKEGIAATPTFKMFQDPEGPGGLLVLRPTHHRNGSCSGIVLGMLDLRLFSNLLPEARAEMKWQILNVVTGKPVCGSFAGDIPVNELSASRDFTLTGGEKWRLILTQSPRDFTGKHNRIMLLLALIFAAGLGSSLLIITGHTRKTEEVVEIRTAELSRAKDAAEKSQREAEKANAARGDFLATMSHEIRTPLNGVLGLSRILEEDRTLNDDQRGLISTLRGSGESLHALLNNILDLSKIDSGKFSLDPHSFDLNELCRKVIVLHQISAQDKGLSLEFIGEATPPVLLGDSLRLWQCLGNLIGNAIKFTGRGGVKLRLSGQRSATASWTLSIAIEDSGEGIPPDKIDQIFRPFEQSDSSISRRHGGTGLGLSISAKLIELMGGKLRVSSSPGAGSVFTLEITLPEGDPAAIPAQIGPSPDLNLELRILIVEDNLVNQKVITRMLARYGCELKLAGDGLQALKTIELEEPFDLILMDLHMPEKNGYEATEELRRLGCRDLIVALTADAFEETHQHCRQVGFDDFITKPLNKQELLRILRLATERRLRGN